MYDSHHLMLRDEGIPLPSLWEGSTCNSPAFMATHLGSIDSKMVTATRLPEAELHIDASHVMMHDVGRDDGDSD